MGFHGPLVLVSWFGMLRVSGFRGLELQGLRFRGGGFTALGFRALRAEGSPVFRDFPGNLSAQIPDNPVLGPKPASPTQRAQYPLNKEYTLNYKGLNIRI